MATATYGSTSSSTTPCHDGQHNEQPHNCSMFRLAYCGLDYCSTRPLTISLDGLVGIDFNSILTLDKNRCVRCNLIGVLQLWIGLKIVI